MSTTTIQENVTNVTLQDEQVCVSVFDGDINQLVCPDVFVPGQSSLLSQGLNSALGYYYPKMFNTFITGTKPALGGGASNGKSIQNDPDVDRVYPASTPEVATFTSDDNNDTFGGLGAQLLYVQGINGDGYIATELVQLAGQAGASTSNTYYCIHEVAVALEGASGQQDLIRCEINGTPQGAITADHKRLLTGHILVPINYTFFPVSQTQSGNTNVSIKPRIQANVFGGGNVSVRANDFNVDKSVASLHYEGAPFPLASGVYLAFDAFGGGGDNVSVYAAGIMVHNNFVNPMGHTLTFPPGIVLNTESIGSPATLP